MSQAIAPLDVLTSDDQFPEREKSDECNSSVRVKAADLAERCSKLFDHLGVVPAISSGFRTSAVNAKVGGSCHSAHLSGEACDFHDENGSLGRAITTALLEQFNLYMESTQHTPGWVHLTTRAPGSGNRVFRP